MKKYHDIEHLRPLEVEVGPSEEDFHFAMRLFRGKVQGERILVNLKKRSRFEKPSIKKRRKQREAQTREFLTLRAIKRMESEKPNSG